MLVGLTWALIALSLAVGILALLLGIAAKNPNDFTLIGSALIFLGLVVQVVVAIFAPILGNNPTGDLLEFWMYLGTALLIMAAGAIWPLIERGRNSLFVLGIAALTIAIMVWRMDVIWNIQGV